MDTTRIDWERAELVCGRLLAVRARSAYPYNNRAALPQSFIPVEITQDPLVHSRFLFGTCHYMRGTIKSDYAVKMLIELFGIVPQLFNPFEASRMEFATVRGHLHDMIAYQSEQISASWIENSRRMVRHWKGDPRNIFVGLNNPDALYLRVTNKVIDGDKPATEDSPHWGFLGFQKKMASMLAYFLMDAGLVPDTVISPPVDFHLLRVMLATGIIKTDLKTDTKLRYEHLTPYGIAVLEKYCRVHMVKMVDLADALWLLSGVLCSRAPGNKSVGRRKGKEMPKGRPTPAILDWNNPDTIQQYNRACGSCPIEALCSLSVLSGTYYESGAFTLLPRGRPLQLFSSLPQLMRPKRGAS